MSLVKIGRDILETVEETDLSKVSEVDAKELLKLVMWFYASRYREPGDTRPRQFSGLLPAQVKQRMESEYGGLLKAAGFTSGTMSAPTVLSYIEKGGAWFWEKRDRLSWLKFVENQELQDRAKRFQVEVMDDEDASRGIRLKAAKDLVDTTRIQGVEIGYAAAQKVEVFAGTSKDTLFTADDMSQAAAEALEFEQRLLESNNDDVIGGEIVP